MARAEALQGWSRTLRRYDPFLPLWRLLTSVRFALALIGFLALGGLLGTLIPQIPGPMQDNPAAIRGWLDFQDGKFGILTEPMYRLGLFNVFDSRWFLAGLGLLVASVVVCTANRLAPTWRNVVRPQREVPSAFFDRAANRLAFAGAQAGQLEQVLRRRHFKVERIDDGGRLYLFADRFSWAQLGTFVSHLALILFLAGGIVSHISGYSALLFMGEQTTMPVFPVSHANQMQVEVLDTTARFDGGGSPLDYRTELVIYQGGHEVKRGVTTVNDPLEYDGYRFHQASYFGQGAALRVRDAASGRTLYNEVLPLEERVPAPLITVRDASGEVQLEDLIPPTDFLEGSTSGAVMTVPRSGRQFWVGLRPVGDDWRMVLYEVGGTGQPAQLAPGGTIEANGLTFTFKEATSVPSLTTAGIPGDASESMLVLSEDADGKPYLTLLGPVDSTALTLYPEQPVRIGEREYTFEGRREFAGIQVKRDPGANFIWVAAGLLLVGLAVTFYVPRLRMWGRVGPDGIVLAGLAEKSGSFRSEAAAIAEELGATVKRDTAEEGDDAG